MGLLLLLLLSPILYEVGMLYYAKWNTVMGTYTVARTPILDAILKAIDASRQFTRQRTTLTFLRGNWKSVYAIPFALAWALIASLVLRKAR